MQLKTTEEIEKLVASFELIPHPEGGFYKETYRSEGVIPKAGLPQNYNAARNYSTAIYFLLTSENFSSLHRIKQDEQWHFYGGTSPLLVHVISPNGNYNCMELGNDILNGEKPQAVVTGESWFGATVKNKNAYCLVGCSVAPGFDFQDFELAKRQELIKRFPKHEEIITQLTRS